MTRTALGGTIFTPTRTVAPTRTATAVPPPTSTSTRVPTPVPPTPTPDTTDAPGQINGLQLWLDASRLTGFSDGAGVTSWNDRSGNGHAAIQTTASRQPTYRSNVLNGLPVVRFDGVDDALDAGEIDLYRTGQTIFVVARVDVAKNQIFVSQHAGSTDGSWFFAGTPTGLKYVVINADSHRVDYNASVAGVTNFGIWTARYTGGRMDIAVAGRDLSGNGAQSGLIKDDNQHVVVGDYGGPGWKLDGDVAEIIVYNRSLSAIERTAVENYLGTKYALRLARTPQTVRGLRMWLDSTQFAGVANGAAVDLWEDQSGLGNNAVQSDPTRRPTYRESVLHEPPVVRFDGVDDLLDAGELGLYTEGQTIFVVARSNTAANQVLVGQHAGSLNGSWYFADTPQGLRYMVINSADVRVDSVAPEQVANNFGLWVARYDGKSLRIFANGTPVGAPVNQSGAIKDDNRHVYVGNYAGPGWTFNGDIAEVLVYDRALDPSERWVVEDYLAQSCGVQLQRRVGNVLDGTRFACRGKRHTPNHPECQFSAKN